MLRRASGVVAELLLHDIRQTETELVGIVKAPDQDIRDLGRDTLGLAEPAFRVVSLTLAVWAAEVASAASVVRIVILS